MSMEIDDDAFTFKKMSSTDNVTKKEEDSPSLRIVWIQQYKDSKNI